MLVACRLAGLSALETYYAGVDTDAQMLDRLERAGRKLQRRDLAAGEDRGSPSATPRGVDA
jgi:hypothetical protein